MKFYVPSVLSNKLFFCIIIMMCIPLHFFHVTLRVNPWLKKKSFQVYFRQALQVLPYQVGIKSFAQ